MEITWNRRAAKNGTNTIIHRISLSQNTYHKLHASLWIYFPNVDMELEQAFVGMNAIASMRSLCQHLGALPNKSQIEAASRCKGQNGSVVLSVVYLLRPFYHR